MLWLGPSQAAIPSRNRSTYRSRASRVGIWTPPWKRAPVMAIQPHWLGSHIGFGKRILAHTRDRIE